VLVTPCILLAEPTSIEFGVRPRGIEVMDARVFGTWLAGLPRLLSPAALDGLSSIASAASTWSAVGSLDSTGRDEFRRLAHEISEARRRRLAWAILGAAVTQAAVLASLAATVVGAFGHH
jgi:hypothetical protein